MGSYNTCITYKCAVHTTIFLHQSLRTSLVQMSEVVEPNTSPRPRNDVMIVEAVSLCSGGTDLKREEGNG